MNKDELASINKKLSLIISMLEEHGEDIEYLKKQEMKTRDTENVLAKWGTWYALSFMADKVLGIDNGSFGPRE